MTVKLWVARHAHEDPPRSDQPERHRKLSQMGGRVATALGTALAKSKIAPAHILHAPSTRSQQTAAIVANALSARPRRSITDPPVDVRAEADPELEQHPDLRKWMQQTIDDSDDGQTGEVDDAAEGVRHLMIVGEAENLDPLLRDVFGDASGDLQHGETRMYEMPRDLAGTEKPKLVQRWIAHGAGTQAPKFFDVM